MFFVDVFAKGATYYAGIATVIFSRVFHVLGYLVFARKLMCYFIGVCIINPAIGFFFFLRRKMT